ncbi:MAG TPA: MauE/DoxX family redox-associated membrane protein [Vicinamibacteria bacterium]|nr:MauE/DoxX family redox-associated membrane protein [Vicinamibacteria bacterium]
MRWLRHPALYWVVAIGLGAVFVYASVDKIAHPQDFARIVYRYRLAGPTAALGVVPANTWAVVLPWIEAITGALLITGLWRREAAVVAGGLLVLFLAAVSYVLWQGIDVAHCGCFTVNGEGRGAGWMLIASDLGLLAAAAYVALVRPTVRTTAAQPAAVTTAPARG